MCNLVPKQGIKACETKFIKTMDGEFAAFLFMFSMAISIAGLIFFYLFSRHRERTQMIEKGADASLFQTEPERGITSLQCY